MERGKLGEAGRREKGEPASLNVRSPFVALSIPLPPPKQLSLSLDCLVASSEIFATKGAGGGGSVDSSGSKTEWSWTDK